MMRLTPEQLRVFQQTGRHAPELTDLLRAMRQEELEAMALCAPQLDVFCTFKGRVQMLTELIQQLERS